jgi:DNA-binding transcriptional regulator YiaG
MPNQTPIDPVKIPTRLDVASIRARTRYTQANFARAIGVSAGTLRQWQQHREPTGAARVLLAPQPQTRPWWRRR